MAHEVEPRVDDPLGAGSHDLPVPAGLSDYLQKGWSETAAAGVRPLAPPERCAARRERLAARLPGERLVVPAGRPAQRGNGQEHRFRPTSDFVYLIGYGAAGSVLVVEPDGDARLYVDPPTGHDGLDFFQDAARGQFWVGARPLLDDIELALGIECRPLAELPHALDSVVSTRVRRGIDAEVEKHVDAEDGFDDRELRAVLSELRLVKDNWEIEQIERAVDAAVAAYEDVGRALPAARNERDVEAAFVRRALVEGHDAAFGVIAAAGPHATTLHWIRNDGPLRAGELLLLDAGVELGTHYVSDLTRTYPLGGTYTALQRDLLELLNDAHEAALASVAAGRSFRDFRTASAAVLGEGLAARGLLPDDLAPEEAQRRFSICGPGHMLGLDVHDCAHARAATYLEGVLEEGHVLTVEPGLYFQPDDLTVPAELRGLGLRVEDDVVVTADGCRNLSERLPRRADEVEEWLARLASR